MNAENLKPAILIMGATGVGKSALAFALHERLPVEVISVDSSQVYRGLDIGTAKPTPEECARVPHRLIDIRDPVESYSAAEFCDDAVREMAAITAAGRIPMLVGGTMFYFRALENGLDPLPAAAPEIRRRLHDEATRVGWPALHARLTQVDPTVAARIGPNDAHRIQRALEIAELQGSLAYIRDRPSKRLPYRFIRFALWPRDRSVLHARIERRFDAMLARGLIAEVEALYRRGDLHAGLPAIKCAGYRQVWNYLTGAIGCNQMREQAIAATRQVAKRQMTWLRSYSGVESMEVDDSPPIEQVVSKLLQFKVGTKLS